MRLEELIEEFEKALAEDNVIKADFVKQAVGWLKLLLQIRDSMPSGAVAVGMSNQEIKDVVETRSGMGPKAIQEVLREHDQSEPDES